MSWGYTVDLCPLCPWYVHGHGHWMLMTGLKSICDAPLDKHVFFYDFFKFNACLKSESGTDINEMTQYESIKQHHMSEIHTFQCEI